MRLPGLFKIMYSKSDNYIRIYRATLQEMLMATEEVCERRLFTEASGVGHC